MMTTTWRFGIWSLSLTILAGCGGAATQTADDGSPTRRVTHSTDSPSSASTDDSQQNGVIPTSATEIKKPTSNGETESDADNADSTDLSIVQPGKDSAEDFILRITQLKLKPLSDATEPQNLSAEKLAELRRQRNEQIIELAREAIGQTHNDSTPARKRVFDLAVHHLLDAQLQLALMGDEEHVADLQENAVSLYERDKKSKTAVEAAQTVISLARTNSQRYGQQEPKWLEEYSRLAQQFAKNFAHEERLAIPTLFAAAQSCEFHGLNTEAQQCYTAIREQYPENPAAERVVPILRRLNIRGKPLQLAGPTIGGGFVKAEELVGRPLLVIFWKTSAQPFVRQLGSLKGLLGQINPERLNVVSVNLDDDDNESAVQAFLETNELDWQTIFFSEPEQRGWNNPNATHYGIYAVPQYWVVSSKGNVVETADDVKQIEPLLRKLIAPKATPETK